MDKRIVGVNAGNVWHVLNEVKRISEKSKFPGKYQEQPYVQPAIFSGGRFLFVPKASTPALIDEVNALPLLI